MTAELSWNYATVKDAGLIIDPSSATSVVYNATSRQFFAAMQWHGIYSSTDGANWDRLNSPARRPESSLLSRESPPLQPASCIAENLRSCPDATRCISGTWTETTATG